MSHLLQTYWPSQSQCWLHKHKLLATTASNPTASKKVQRLLTSTLVSVEPEILPIPIFHLHKGAWILVNPASRI